MSRGPDPKGWKGFSAADDEGEMPVKPRRLRSSRFMAPFITFCFAVLIGIILGVVLYLCVFTRLLIMALFPKMGFPGYVTGGVLCSVGLWALAFYRERRTRYVADHYKDARPPYKRPVTERERVWRERQIERELETGAEAEADGDGADKSD